MSISIITTTINFPTIATLKFAELAHKNNWNFVIVGDLRTPHEEYQKLQTKYKNAVTYLHPSTQDELFPELSRVIGWKTIQRRNIGFACAYRHLTNEIVATVDDDNIPYDDWGQDLYVGKSIYAYEYRSRNCDIFFDPFSATNQSHLWHRGFPIEYLENKNNIELLGREKVLCKVQADFWDGDPDIDAICRLTKKPLVKFNKFDPFYTRQYAPFNSQNTFLHISAFPEYSVWTDVGRMDDIWASYYFRNTLGTKEAIVYCAPSVYQERNPQDLVKNLENECIGYRHTKDFVERLSKNSSTIFSAPYISEKTVQFLNAYTALF